MRKFLFIILIFYFIGFIFFKSNTIETKQWKEDIGGVGYDRTSYSLNWGNFIKFSKDLFNGTIFKLKSFHNK